MEEDFMSQVPIWVVATIGKEVALTREFSGPCETYSAGSRGILRGIECYPWNNGGKAYVIVSLDLHDPDYVENFTIDHIRPIVDKVKVSFDLQNGVIAF
jgi:hypothetical protein